MFDEEWAQAAREAYGMSQSPLGHSVKCRCHFCMEFWYPTKKDVYMGNFRISEAEAKLNEAQDRKGQPLATGCLDYFPDALLAIAECSRIGNDQHNPGEPLHWDRSKSDDEADSLLRHLKD